MTAFEQNTERVECYVCDGTGQSSEHDRCDPPNYYECERCDGEGTVLIDKPCSECGGSGRGRPFSYDGHGGVKCLRCNACKGTGVEPRDKRMERLMREADQYIRLSTDTTERIAFVDGFGAHQTNNVAAPWQEIELKMAAFTGWSYQNWLMRKDGQG